MDVTTWINFEDIMLSETSQSQNDKYYMISTYIRLSKIIESLSQNHRKQKVGKKHDNIDR